MPEEETQWTTSNIKLRTAKIRDFIQTNPHLSKHVRQSPDVESVTHKLFSNHFTIPLRNHNYIYSKSFILKLPAKTIVQDLPKPANRRQTSEPIHIYSVIILIIIINPTSTLLP